MMNSNDQNGVSLIAAIFIIVVLGFMGVMFLSMINTGSFTAVNDIQSAQALYVAEGGVEFAQLALAQNLDWYLSVSDPMSSPSSTTLNLGAGSFTVTTNLPGTKLRAKMPIGSTNPARVYTTNRFFTAGCIRIEDEFIQYTGLGSTVAACVGQPPCFTGIVRGAAAAAACFGGGTTLAAHTRGISVYPVSSLGTAMLANCSDMALITIATNTKFLSAGTLDIETEEVSYSGSSISGGTMTLTGIQRCLDAASQITPLSHAVGIPVTPVLVNDDSADNQAEIISIGTVGAATRTVKKTVGRNF
jgi:hypothetical protein